MACNGSTTFLESLDFPDRVGDFSDEDEEFSSNEDGVDEAEGSDSEPMLEDNVGRRALQRQRQRQAARAGAIPANARVCCSRRSGQIEGLSKILLLNNNNITTNLFFVCFSNAISSRNS